LLHFTFCSSRRYIILRAGPLYLFFINYARNPMYNKNNFFARKAKTLYKFSVSDGYTVDDLVRNCRKLKHWL